MQKKVIIIGGATASGKTSTAIQLAQQLECEIISADSRQVYREMHIGTAKPSSEELDEVPHHLIGHLSIHDAYSVGDFERDALPLIQNLHEQSDFVIVVGGTGLYHRAIAEGLDQFPDVSAGILDTLKMEYKKNGLNPLQAELMTKDPKYAEDVDLQNPHRIIRALSVIRQTGQTFSSYHHQPKNPRPFITKLYALDWPRELLYSRINERVDIMMKRGLLEEVRSLLPYRHLNALQTVGYQELFEYLDDTWTLDFAVEKIKQHTRNYAKRQMTWFRNQGDYELITRSAMLEVYS